MSDSTAVNVTEGQAAEGTTTEAGAQVEGTTATTDPKKQVVEVKNPSEEEMKAILEHVKVNYNFDVDVKPVTFNFKKSLDKETGIETIRKPVNLAIPYPSVQGIIAILEKGGKELELLIEVMEFTVNNEARNILYDDLTLTAATFPVDKISWEAIANLPKAQRRGGGIAKEIWEAFAQDYTEVMPAATGKTVEQVANAAKILLSKLTQVRTNEPVLQLLIEQLAVYAEASPNIEEYQDCVAFLLNKAEAYLNLSPEELLANL